MLYLKLVRDLMHLWAQALAIALVLAAGVATLVLANGAYRSLAETRSAYYERFQFAHLFATAKRIPRRVIADVAEIDGIAHVEGRIQSFAILDIRGMTRPVTGQILSLPLLGRPRLNALVLRSGRWPEAGQSAEVIVSETFANAHKFKLGEEFFAILNGRKKRLRVVGTALSPEYIYALGPGDLIPDDKRFGVVWMGARAAESAFDLKGAFNSLSVQLRRDANEDEVIEAIDLALERYGGTGAFGRDDQVSHAFIDAQLGELRTMRRIVPPIFFAVAAFLINMALGRLIDMERPQIGLLRALGYKSFDVATHYMMFATVIALVGIVLGCAAGIWLGRGMTEIYAEFYQFPFLVFQNPPDVFVLASGIGLAAAWLGAWRAVRSAAALSPAVAMAPPAPTRYGRIFISMTRLAARYSQKANLVLRHTLRAPVRSALTVLGVAASGGLLVMTLSNNDAIDFMIDVTFFQTSRQDITVSFSDHRPLRVMHDLKNLPGVLRAEPLRDLPARLHFGPYSKRLAVQGIRPGADLQQLLDTDLKAVVMPEFGIAITEKLAALLKVRQGEFITVRMTQGRRRSVQLPVTQILQSYIGLQAFVDLDRLNAFAGDGEIITSANLSVDGKFLAPLYRELKELPAVAAVMLLKSSLAMFRKTLAQNMNIMMTVFISMSVIITFGVVYNSARVQLSERARELASLRVLGFTRTEVSQILLGEIALLTALAIPLSWALGYGFNWMLISSFDSELFRVPFVIERATYVHATLTVIAAAVVAALLVRTRLDSLDLVEVLKTRE